MTLHSPAGRLRLRRLLPPRWRLPSLFDVHWYMTACPDVPRNRVAAALHWLRHGRYEGRLPCAGAAAPAEAALRAGTPGAEAVLEDLARAGAPAERIGARLALARAAAARGDYAGAADLGRVSVRDDLACGLGMPGPLAFAAEMALRRGDPALAGARLDLWRQCFGPRAEWRLLRAALALQAGSVTGWQEDINRLCSAHSLSFIALNPPDERAAFDRLCARAGRSETAGPLVSVLLPARDAGAMLDTALAGLVAQSWRNLEILVIDNGSRDDTAARAAHWQVRDPRIRLIDGGAEPGVYAARNLGLTQARGAFITLHDADDWSHPDRILRQVRALDGSDAPACLTDWVRMSEDLCPSAQRPDVTMVHPNLSSLMLRRAVLERAGFWDRVIAAGDTEYIARLRRLFGAGAVMPVLPQMPLGFGRITAGSLTMTAGTGLSGPAAAARAAYLAAAQVWHRSGADLHLPRHPAQRPFPAPSALLPAGEVA